MDKYWIIIDQPHVKWIPDWRNVKYYTRVCEYGEASAIYRKYLARAKGDQHVFLAVEKEGEFQLLT